MDGGGGDGEDEIMYGNGAKTPLELRCKFFSTLNPAWLEIRYEAHSLS